MLHKYKMLPLVAVMLVMSLVFSAQAAPVVPDFVPLVQSAGKAVVNISTEKKVMQRGGMPSEMFRGLPPEFERFFEQFEGNSRNAKPRTQRSLGTGFLIPFSSTFRAAPARSIPSRLRSSGLTKKPTSPCSR